MHILKHIALFLLLFLASEIARGQTISGFYEKQKSIEKTGLLILGSWALGNMGISGFMYRRSKGSTRYFYEMNLGWNTVNLALAGMGVWKSSLSATHSLEFWEIIENQNNLEKLLLFNAGLDLGYIATGFLLKERSKNVIKQSSRLEGYGHSLLLQGGFLLLFDSLFYLTLSRHGNHLQPLFEKLYVSPNQIGFLVSF